MGKITRQELSSGLTAELDKSGNLSSLTTTEKGSLVSAINEVNAKPIPVTSVASKIGDVTLSKTDVGLGSVENYGIASQAEAEAGTSNVKYMTPLRVKDYVSTIPTPWSEIQRYDTAGSFSWVAPDLNNGQPYEVGVFILGGGGSGGSAKYTGSANTRALATGGGSGYGKCITLTVTPSVSYPVVVGAGGVGVTTNTTAYQQIGGNAGGTSSFNGTTSLGGHGGNASSQSSDGGYTKISGANGATASDSFEYGSQIASKTAPIYGETPRMDYYSSVLYYGITSPLSCINVFDGKFYSGGAGGGAGATSTGTLIGSQPVTTLLDGFSAGAGMALYQTTPSATGNSATSIGCGGGAIALGHASASTATVTSGAGKNGIVIIYKRG